MKTKNVYKHWEIDEKKFPNNGSTEDKILFFIRYAILAPSSHNTQPWRFQVIKNKVKIFTDSTRALVYSDRINREMHISLGCALANLTIAAEHFGFSPEVSYYPEDDLENPAIVVEITKGGIENQLSKLFPYITKRTSNRNYYLKKNIPTDILKELIQYNEEDIEVDFVQDKKNKDKITKTVCESILFAFNDHIFKDELSQWVRSNYTNLPDGMPLFGFNIPGPVSILAPFLIKHMPAKMQAKIDSDLLERSDVLLIISSETDDREVWMKVGKIYEYLTLAALQKGISTSPMAGVVEYDETNKKLREILAIKGRPFFFARMGYATNYPHSTPRRGIKEVSL